MIDEWKFKRFIAEHGFTQKKLANAIFMKPQSLNKRIKNGCEFSSSEIKAIETAMKLTKEETYSLFFGDDVD